MVTLENRLAIYKINTHPLYDIAFPFLDTYLRNENIFTAKPVCKCYSNSIHNHSKVEIIQMSFNKLNRQIIRRTIQKRSS